MPRPKPETCGFIRQSIIELAEDGPIDLQTWTNLTMNSYERAYLYEFVDNETLIHICKQCLSQSTPIYNPVTYNEIVLCKLFPELLERFESKLNATDPF